MIIDNQVAETRVTQVFRNPTSRMLEATYVFPLPEQAAVAELAMWTKGVRRTAVLADVNKARSIYDRITRTRRDPAILEQTGKTSFRIRVFPILPRSEQKIEIVYQETIEATGGVCKYVYPLRDEVATEVKQDLTMAVRIRSAVPVDEVYSPTHEIDVVRGRDSIAAGFEREGVALDDDFVLYYRPRTDKLSFQVTASRRSPEEDGSFLLLLSPGPSAERDVLSKDVLMVMDVSGSMKGRKIERAKESIRYFVHSLGDEDRFNILTFSTGVRSFRPKLVDATRAERDAAIAFIGVDGSGFEAPDFLRLGAVIGVVDQHVGGQAVAQGADFANRPARRRLSGQAERVRPRSPDLAGYQMEIVEEVVHPGAAHMLINAHAPEAHRAAARVPYISASALTCDAATPVVLLTASGVYSASSSRISSRVDSRAAVLECVAFGVVAVAAVPNRIEIFDAAPEDHVLFDEAAAELHLVPHEWISRHYPAPAAARRLLGEARDVTERTAANAIRLLVSGGVPMDDIGLTGSLLIGRHGTGSDVDIVLYGRAAFERARRIVRAALRDGRADALDDNAWREAWRRRAPSLAFGDYVWHERRKTNKFLLDGTKVDLTLLSREPDRDADLRPWSKHGLVCVRGRVVDASAAFDHPSRYRIDATEVQDILVTTATYTGQALEGEVVEACGWLERAPGDAVRLLVGSSREAEGEYLKVTEADPRDA